jgi:periplasmic mercuric ion binding protein
MSRRSLLVVAVLTLPGWTTAVLAENKTVTLSVPSMNCPACPITVRKALQRVEGVEKVTVSYDPKEAVVTFDDGKTSVERLLEATTNAGYPSHLKRVK